MSDGLRPSAVSGVSSSPTERWLLCAPKDFGVEVLDGIRVGLSPKKKGGHRAVLGQFRRWGRSFEIREVNDSFLRQFGVLVPSPGGQLSLVHSPLRLLRVEECVERGGTLEQVARQPRSPTVRVQEQCRALRGPKLPFGVRTAAKAKAVRRTP